MNELKYTIGSNYALGRLSRAIETLRNHADPAVRERASTKIDRWMGVLEGMASGTLTVGSRTPVADTPPWVTLEVAHGGFATGRYLAESPLDVEEQSLLTELSSQIQGDTDRERLNLALLGDSGLELLLDALRDGRYHTEVPEEGALLVIAWLFANGHEEEALDLVDQLRPLMHRLRFYPRLRPTPHSSGSMVRVATVEEVAAPLRNAEENLQTKKMNEALKTWAPLFDRLVELWLDTVEGDAPRLSDKGKISGGWPCKRWPHDWSKRRSQWADEYSEACEIGTYCSKHKHPKSNFSRLRNALEKCENGSSALTSREVGWIRRALANTISKSGIPGSDLRESLRKTQAEVVERPTHAQIARLVATRLSKYPREGGVPSLDPIEVDVSGAEGLPAGTSIPRHIVKKAARALEAPVQDLIERGVIGSSEVLAAILPQITAQVASAGIEDAALRGLFSQIYAAFRRRRSLLLLNLEHQVTLDELPWISALTGLRSDNLGTKKQARQSLEEVTRIALSAFPATILPNPLVREMGALASRGGFEMPLVEEVAADIFMGTFTAKWQKAALVASDLLDGTLYAHYYDLPPRSAYHDAPGGLLARMRSRHRKNTADGFVNICQVRAREAGVEGGSWVAQNGAVIEQSQILTTHNLAVLCQGLDLMDHLRLVAQELTERCFRWVLRRHKQPIRMSHARLQMLKNTAYAWRQAIFFLSFCDERMQARKIEFLESLVHEADLEHGDRLQAAVNGLQRVHGGGRFDESGRLGNGRRFLGWSVGQHWMMAPNDR